MRIPGGFSVKLVGGFALVLLLVSASAVLSLWHLSHLVGRQEELISRAHEGVIFAERFRAAESAVTSATRGFVLTRNLEFSHRPEEADAEADAR